MFVLAGRTAFGCFLLWLQSVPIFSPREARQKLRLRTFRELWPAEVVEGSPYDPRNETIRADV